MCACWGDRSPAPEGPVDDAAVAAALSVLAAFADYRDVTLLVESNGVYADSTRLRRLVETVASPHVAVLWDINHPYRFAGESMAETYANLAPYIRYVHVKDSVMVDGSLRYRMMGQGDLPVREALDVLMANGYSGYVHAGMGQALEP